MKRRSRLALILALCHLSNIGRASLPDTGTNADEQIGNSYFKSNVSKPISQVGGALEDRDTNTSLYLFFNQLRTNHIFYELRAYGIYDKLTTPPPISTGLPTYKERHPLGYGGAGFLGYNININPNLSLLPFIRAQALTNTFVAYDIALAHHVGSTDYGGSIGAKLSRRITDVFAIYSLGYLGYQWSLINERNIFALTSQAEAILYIAGLEFGAPYKINQRVSITPYGQLVLATANPNRAAILLNSTMSQATHYNYLLGIKVGYEF